MNTSRLLSGLLAAMAVTAPATLHALNYNEAVSGDLSDNRLAPTPLTLTLGSNIISGTMGGDPGDGIPLDRDFFSFIIHPGQLLTSINVLEYTPSGQSFYAISAGTSIDIESPSDHLANYLITGNGNILDDMALGSHSGGLGITDPLGPGTYTVWFQELASVVTYQMDYTIAAIPEPSTALFGAALGLVAMARRRRANSPA